MKSNIVYLFFFTCIFSCVEKSPVNLNDEDPLFESYLKKIHNIKLTDNAVIIVLQNNCKACSFETIRFSELVCSETKRETQVYLLVSDNSNFSLNCHNFYRDTLGFFHEYGLYSFYDKIYVLENKKVTYSQDINSENIESIIQYLQKYPNRP